MGEIKQFVTYKGLFMPLFVTYKGLFGQYFVPKWWITNRFHCKWKSFYDSDSDNYLE